MEIIKEPEISVSAYARGTQVNAQDLDDEDFSNDKATTMLLKLMTRGSTLTSTLDLTNRAAYRLVDQHDQEVLGYLSGFKQSALH